MERGKYRFFYRSKSEIFHQDGGLGVEQTTQTKDQNRGPKQRAQSTPILLVVLYIYIPWIYISTHTHTRLGCVFGDFLTNLSKQRLRTTQRQRHCYFKLTIIINIINTMERDTQPPFNTRKLNSSQQRVIIVSNFLGYAILIHVDNAITLLIC